MLTTDIAENRFRLLNADEIDAVCGGEISHADFFPENILVTAPAIFGSLGPVQGGIGFGPIGGAGILGALDFSAITVNLEPVDTDKDGVPDSNDADPNDAENNEIIVTAGLTLTEIKQIKADATAIADIIIQFGGVAGAAFLSFLKDSGKISGPTAVVIGGVIGIAETNTDVLRNTTRDALIRDAFIQRETYGQIKYYPN